jgi:hypothetical protein
MGPMAKARPSPSSVSRSPIPSRTSPNAIFALALQARELRDVNLKNAQGHIVARAVIHFDDGQLKWEIKDATLRQSAWQVKLSNGPKCFQPSEPVEPDEKDLCETMKSRKLLLTLQPDGANAGPACGKVRQWFSPWRNSRR